MKLFNSPGIEIKYNDSGCWFQSAKTVAIKIKIKKRKVKISMNKIKKMVK